MAEEKGADAALNGQKRQWFIHHCDDGDRLPPAGPPITPGDEHGAHDAARRRRRCSWRRREQRPSGPSTLTGGGVGDPRGDGGGGEESRRMREMCLCATASPFLAAEGADCLAHSIPYASCDQICPPGLDARASTWLHGSRDNQQG